VARGGGGMGRVVVGELVVLPILPRRPARICIMKSLAAPGLLKRIQGNPGKRKLNSHEPAFSGFPRCPVWLTDVAKSEWNRIIAELAALDMTPCRRFSFPRCPLFALCAMEIRRRDR
jgi:hypothetical protein